MQIPSAPVSTIPVLRSRPGVGHAIGAVVLLLAIAIVKPWGDGPSPAPRSRGDTAAASARTAIPWAAAVTPPPSTAAAGRSPGPREIACTALSWEIVSLDRLADWTARAWTPASPVLAHDPLDATIGEVRLASSALLAVGACAPGTTPDGGSAVSVPAAVVAAWRREGTDARPLDLELVGRPDADAGLALLYRPTGSTAPHRAWPAGHFILELAPVAGAGRTASETAGPRSDALPRWFIGLDVGAAP